MPAEKPFDFLPPGGQFQNLVDVPVITVVTSTVAPLRMVQHIITSMTINTITPPHTGYVGPLYLIADSAFAIGGTGNIATTQGTPKVVGHAYGFIYDPTQAKWYEIGNPV